MTSKVAFIGLGVMGYPMAGHLVRAGHAVTVFNRTTVVAQRWEGEYSGSIAMTPAAATKDADFICVCVGNDEDVRDVSLGHTGIFASIKAGAILIDHTTASAALAEELSRHARDAAACFIDAPVSGGQAGAENGQLTIMCGGEARDFNRASQLMAAYAKAMELIGPVGHGQKAKMMNQICIAGLVQALSESINFGRMAGLDVNKVIAAIQHGAAQSWQMENRFEAMLAGEFDFGFAVDWMRKDLRIAMDEAQRIGAPLPVTKLVDTYYEDVQRMGGQRWDTCSLIARLTPDNS